MCVGGPGASNKKYYLDNYQDKFSAIAKELDVWLMPGTFYEQIKDQVFNVAPVFNPDGIIVQKCRKNFPWLPYEKGVASSNDICVFSIDETTKSVLAFIRSDKLVKDINRVPNTNPI